MIQKDLDSLKMQIHLKNILYILPVLIDSIRENDEVTFELEEGKKGLNAVNVKQA